ncbi:MAG: gamma-glutamyl-gamma-aminobutyrate hydrolase family protein [Victivallaceae bacterium]|nr:gamma-glutamyl-gamma-aminobutyrate hydrolase family protein [Victivallaceae bacterium]
MKIRKRHVMLFFALLCLPLLILLLPVMLIARFGRPRRGIRVALAVSDRWPAYLQYARLPYDLAILRAGAKVITVTPNNIAELDKLLDQVDAVIVSGGEDISPFFSLTKHSGASDTNIRRDELEMMMIRKAEQRNLPLLCICRGMQLLTMVHGGHLVCHNNDPAISRKHKSTISHMAMHPVFPVAGTKLDAIFKREKIGVNSIHHQHVGNPGDLIVSGHSDDDIIEAVEVKGQRFVLGVQWHPELLAIFDYRSEKLFTALVDAACEGEKLEVRS